MQVDAAVPRRGLQQLHELPFGGLQRRIRHVVDQADGEHRIGRFLTALELVGFTRLRGASAGLTIRRCLSNRCVMRMPADLFRRLKPRTM